MTETHGITFATWRILECPIGRIAVFLMGSAMYYPPKQMSVRLRVIVAALALGSLLSFGLGQALGHRAPSPRTAAHVAVTRHATASAGGSLVAVTSTTSRAHPTARTTTLPNAAPALQTQNLTSHGEGDHAGDHGNHGKHDSQRQPPVPPPAPPKGGTDGGSSGDTSSD